MDRSREEASVMRPTVRWVLWLLIGGLLVFTSGVSRANTTINVNIGPPPPIVLAAPPPLVVVPGVPVVSYVPSVQVDLFFFQKQWYYAHGGHWWVGPSYRGPWVLVGAGRLPQPIVAVPVRYYKVPPGHLKDFEGDSPGRGKGKGHGHS
jgi:hypothetical protein